MNRWSAIFQSLRPKPKARSRSPKVSRHFREHELRCKCGCGTMFVTARSLAKLDLFRDILGVPVYLNSACRCPIHNQREGGVPLSKHRSTAERPSCAYDVNFIKMGVTKTEVISAAKKAGFKGLGLYRTFVHIDDRERHAQW